MRILLCLFIQKLCKAVEEQQLDVNKLSSIAEEMAGGTTEEQSSHLCEQHDALRSSVQVTSGKICQEKSIHYKYFKRTNTYVEDLMFKYNRAVFLLPTADSRADMFVLKKERCMPCMHIRHKLLTTNKHFSLFIADNNKLVADVCEGP